MNIKQIRYFIAVAEEHHVGRAAARLNMSQPPLTRQIQNLEEEVGVALFRRTPHGVELTEAGRSFWHDAVEILRVVEMATERTRRVDRGQTGRLDVGVFGSAAITTIPEILYDFTRSHPHVELILHNEPFSHQVEALLRRSIMIGFDRYVPNNAEINTELVCEDSLIAAVNSNSPLAQQNSISVQEMVSARLSGGEKKSPNKETMFFLERNFGNAICRASDMLTLIGLIGAGLGFGVVPESLKNINFPNVAFRPLKGDEKMSYNLYCYYRKDERSPILREILESIGKYRESKSERQ